MVAGVAAKPKVEVPAPRAGQNAPLLASPNFAHAEQVEYEQKDARLREIEAYMDECANPSMEFAVDVLDVTISVEDQELRHNNYHQYALVAIKNAEKRLHKDAHLLHPDACPIR